MNLRDFGDGTAGVALDEAVDRQRPGRLLRIFGGEGPGSRNGDPGLFGSLEATTPRFPAFPLVRSSPYLEHPVFHRYHSETEMLRYMHSPGGEGPLAQHQHDPAGVVHHEAERHHRDDPGELARVRPDPPLRPGGPGGGTTGSSATWSGGWGDLGLPAVRSSPTPGPRASTPGSWSSGPTTRTGARGTGTSASSPRRPTGRTRPRRSWRG
jgi:hypothetical protein